MKAATAFYIALGIAPVIVFAVVLIKRPQAVKPRITVNAESLNSYRWTDSRAKLERIGRAIQLYREAAGYKLPPDRATRADAGLPPRLVREIMTPSGPWTVLKQDLFVESTRQWTNSPFQLGSHFTFIIDEIERRLLPKELEAIWKDRGDQLPIAVDLNMYSTKELTSATEPLRIIVLRLGGQVDECQYEPQKMKDLFQNR